VTLRLRAQRAWNTQQMREGKPLQVLIDPSMYALGGRFRAGVSRHTVLKAGRCSSSVSKPELNACLMSALETKM
jgi:hypothetical protein